MVWGNKYFVWLNPVKLTEYFWGWDLYRLFMCWCLPGWCDKFIWYALPFSSLSWLTAYVEGGQTWPLHSFCFVFANWSFTATEVLLCVDWVNLIFVIKLPLLDVDKVQIFLLAYCYWINTISLTCTIQVLKFGQWVICGTTTKIRNGIFCVTWLIRHIIIMIRTFHLLSYFVQQILLRLVWLIIRVGLNDPLQQELCHFFNYWCFWLLNFYWGNPME